MNINAKEFGKAIGRIALTTILYGITLMAIFVLGFTFMAGGAEYITAFHGIAGAIMVAPMIYVVFNEYVQKLKQIRKTMGPQQ